MSDLGREWEKIRKKVEDQAAAHLQAGELQAAADKLDQLASLWERHANSAASRKIEQARKARARYYREEATRLRSGEVSAPDANGEAVQTKPRPGSSGKPGAKKGGGSKDENEVDKVVTGLIHHSNVTWDKIGGLETTKREIKYALGISLAQMPEGVQLAGWRNMLFYGPPGTGKTLLAAATSQALKSGEHKPAVFFNVKVSSVMSKYFGESTKIVSELYGSARDMSPAVIFLDEFEALVGSRGEGDTGTERRILSTILSELDGLSEKGREDIYVLTIAATNRPWDLDPAVLSRFDKKILIPLPDEVTRRAILEIHLTKKGFELECDLSDVVALTEGLSGRELESLSKEVTNRMVAEANADIPNLVDQGLDAVRGYKVKVRALTFADFERAREQVNPVTSSEDMQKYFDWRDAIES